MSRLDRIQAIVEAERARRKAYAASAAAVYATLAEVFLEAASRDFDWPYEGNYPELPEWTVTTALRARADMFAQLSDDSVKAEREWDNAAKNERHALSQEVKP